MYRHSGASIAFISIRISLLVLSLFIGLRTVVFPIGLELMARIFPSELAGIGNRDRLAFGMHKLQVDPRLMRAAQEKARDMAERGYFSHQDPNGTEPWHWLIDSGYEYAYAGENLAFRFEDSEEVQKAWLASESHRANLLSPHYQDIGIGVATGTVNGQSGTFVVQFFASKSE